MNLVQQVETMIRARFATTFIATVFVLFAISCGRDRTSAQPADDKSIEQRVVDLEGVVNDGKTPVVS